MSRSKHAARSDRRNTQTAQGSPALRPSRLLRNPLLRLPIATQLTLGFLLAALIAAFGAGLVGIQRADALDKQSLFYQNLLRDNTFLTNGNDFLQLMNTKRTQTVTDAGISADSLAVDQSSLQSLESLYDGIITGYVQHDLVDQHPDQQELLATGGHADLAEQQRTLALSALRTWQTYRTVQDQFLLDITNKHYADAATLDRVAGEPLNADATSALRALVRFDGRLASSVQDAATSEQNGQAVTTVIAAILAFAGIGGVGWIISLGIVRRLRQLHQVTRAVEEGEIDARARVIGRDEIAEVSVSVNAMLDTIVGLLEETRLQRDALTNAADRLFSDMRVIGAGDLRANAAVSNDPIGMLGNAFNLTVGRFRRFLLRMRTVIGQLDGISRHEASRAQAFFGYVQHAGNASPVVIGNSGNQRSREGDQSIVLQASRVRDIVYVLAQEGSVAPMRTILEAAEEAYLSSSRFKQLLTGLREARSADTVVHLTQLMVQELASFDAAIHRIGNEAYVAQQRTSGGLQQVSAALEQIAVPSQPIIAAGNVSLSPAAHADVVRTAAGFAQEVGALSQELQIIIQEMRASIAPFRVEEVEPEGPVPAVGPMAGYYQE